MVNDYGLAWRSGNGVHIHFSEKICFQYENHYLLLISRASWRKNLVTQVKLGGKNGYLAEKNGNLAEKNGNPAEKNGYRVEKSCYFPSFYMTSTRKLHKITNFEK